MPRFILGPLALILIPTCFTFVPRLGDGVQESSGKSRAVLPHAVGFDLLAHNTNRTCLFTALASERSRSESASLLLMANAGTELVVSERVPIWLQIWRKNDMLGQNHRTIAK